MPRGYPRPPAKPYINGSGNPVYYYTYTPCYNEVGKQMPEPRSCHKPCRPELTKRKIRAGANSPWNKALKEYNQWKYDNKGKLIERNGRFVVPMKGTDDYKKVRKYMKRYMKRGEEEPGRETRSQTAAKAPPKPIPKKTPTKTAPPKKTAATKKPPKPKKVKYDKRFWKEPPSATNPQGVMW